jgi:ABC-type branched-subunit amino acid transport system ATPase component
MAGTKVEILSYGQQKLLALACCVAMRASVLLLDEPIAGVDPDMAARIGALIARLRQSGHTIVFVEHDLVFIRGIADRVVVLHRGRVMTQGAAADVLERPDVIEAYIG